MLKKLALVVLLVISNLQAADVPATGFMESLKNSHGMSMWFGAIIPSILAFISTEAVIRANADQPNNNDIVVVSKFIRWASLFAGAFFLDEWVRNDFKEWTLSSGKK